MLFTSQDIIRVPVEVNKIRRQIPKLPWLQSIAMNICAGILPFSSVYIEMHFVMNNLLLREVRRKRRDTLNDDLLGQLSS